MIAAHAEKTAEGFDLADFLFDQMTTQDYKTPRDIPGSPPPFPLQAYLSAEEVDGRLVLHDTLNGRIHELNSVAAVIWRLCDGTRSPSRITSTVAKLFGTTDLEVSRDVEQTLAQFALNGLTRPVRDARFEGELLVTCVRVALGNEVADSIREAAKGDVDWVGLTEAGSRHGVLPQLHKGLSTAKGSVPEAVLDRLSSHCEIVRDQNRIRATELLDLLALFEANGVRALSLKGPILGESLYGDVAMRQFGDLDIYVAEHQVPNAVRLLTARGYHCDSPDEHIIEAERDVSGSRVAVDLQWELARKRYRFPIALEHLWNRLERTPFANTAVLQPQPDDYALILTAHAAKHCWSRLGWITDFALLLRRYGDTVDYRELLLRARRAGAERSLLLGMRLATDVLGAELPAYVGSHMRDQRSVSSLARELRDGLFLRVPEDPTFQGPYGPLKGGFLYLRSRERIRDKWPFIWYLIRYSMARMGHSLVPNHHDRDVIELPSFAGFLYYLIRPLRLARIYGGRVLDICWSFGRKEI